jgi:hypothetical protein
MAVNAEKEITKLWSNLHSAQAEICKTYYRWRQVALDVAGEGADERELALKAAYRMGKDVGKDCLPRLNWLKGEEAFLLSLGRLLAGMWAREGALTSAEQGEDGGEVYIRCTRCPWPSVAKQYGVPMEEVALVRERFFEAILEDVSVFFNIGLGIEMLKAIPRGEGEYLLRLYKKEE